MTLAVGVELKTKDMMVKLKKSVFFLDKFSVGRYCAPLCRMPDRCGVQNAWGVWWMTMRTARAGGVLIVDYAGKVGLFMGVSLGFTNGRHIG